MKKILVVLLLPIVFCSALENNQFQFDNVLGLAELIGIALENNPETEKVWSGVKRAQAALGSSKSRLYPHLDARGSVTHAREVKFPNGPDTTFTSYGGELNLNYLLCDFGETRAAVRAAKEGLSASKWWADFAIQKVISDVASNYYELLNARELLETRESSLSDARVILDASKELRTAGLRSENDYITVKAAVSEILMSLAQQKAAVAIAYGKLLMSLGVPLETKLDVQTKPEGMQNPLFEEGIDTLLATAQAERADLMARQAALAGMNAQVDRAKRASLPKLRVIGQGGWFEYGKHSGDGYNFSAGVAIDVPLFKGFEHIYQKRQALADAEISLAELKELQNAVAFEVLSCSETVKAAFEALHYSEEFFADAFKSYCNSLESYKAGLINVFDLLHAQRKLADARNKQAQARTVCLVSLSQLAFAVGSINK
jgi:outer membrane protein